MAHSNPKLQSCAVFLVLLSAQLLICAQEPGIRPAPHPIRLEVHGQVRYADGRRPAAHVLVRLESFNGGMAGQMLTDRDGRFRFSGVASRQYTLVVHAPGYRDVSETIDLLTKTSEYVNLELVPLQSERPQSRVIGYIDASVPAAARKEFEKADLALSQNRQTDAIRHLEIAVKLYPGFFATILSLGTLYMDSGAWLKAEEYLLTAVRLNPKSPNAFFALGELYLYNDRLVEAEEFLKAGLQLENRSWQAHFSLARVYWKRADLIRTGKQLALALQLNPNSADAHLLAGDVFIRANKPADALMEYRDYLRLQPKGPHADKVKQLIRKIETLPTRTDN